MKYILLLIFIGSLFQSCKILVEKKYGMNKSFHFGDREQYADFLNEKGFPKTNILIIDSTSLADFYGNLTKSNLTVYYGSFWTIH